MASSEQAKEWSARLGVYLVGFLLLIVGFAYPAWSRNGPSQFGLWQFCDNRSGEWICVSIHISSASPIAHTVRAFTCISLAAAVIAGAAYIKYPTSGLPAILQSVSGLFTIIAILVFRLGILGIYIDISVVGWAMWLYCLGGVVLAVNGIVLMCMIKKEEWSEEKVWGPWSKAPNEDDDSLDGVSSV